MKYIMLEWKAEDGSFTQKIPVIFPSQLVHSLMAKHVSEALKEHGFPEAKAVSAGSIKLHDASVFGDSETLKLESSEDDEATILTYDLFQGIDIIV